MSGAMHTLDRRPRLVDLFACAGGAGTGYYRAGFDVYAVDIDPQPNNPHPFHQGDALDALVLLIIGGAVPFTHEDGTVEWLTLADFDAIHASPPCQGYTALAAVHGNERPKLVEPVRDLLEQTGLPFIIENVQGSPVAQWQQAMGIDWTNVRREIAEAIPPAYTEHIGRQLIAHLETAERAE